MDFNGYLLSMEPWEILAFGMLAFCAIGTAAAVVAERWCRRR